MADNTCYKQPASCQQSQPAEQQEQERERGHQQGRSQHDDDGNKLTGGCTFLVHLSPILLNISYPVSLPLFGGHKEKQFMLSLYPPRQQATGACTLLSVL